MSVRQFREWQTYVSNREKEQFDKEWGTSKQDYYLAQITLWVYLLRHAVVNLLSSNPKSPEYTSIKDFLIEFEGANKIKKKITEEERQKAAKARLDIQKAAFSWFITGGMLNGSGGVEEG